VNLKIRPARPEDADALSQIAFAAKAYWGYPARWMQIWKPQLTFSPDYFKANEGWVAEKDRFPVAFYTLEERENNGWLEDLWVSPDFIGQGLGREMFSHALELCRQRGYVTLQLEADPNAVGFYRKMGMQKVGERQSEVDGQPRILPIMELKL
jgi:GNAT superfamily N-acetyltransferase